MSFNKYYQDELAFLRDMGREFAEANPDMAGWLEQPGADPDVERLLEGFAFLTGRIRQKLDDELPELTHSLMELLWPHYLRPIPSMTIMQLRPLAKAGGQVKLTPRGAEVASVPIDGTSCRFRLGWDVPVVPLRIERLEVGPAQSPYLKLGVRVEDGANLIELGLHSLRLHFAGESSASRALLLCVCRYLESATARAPDGTKVNLQGLTSRQVGFSEEEALIPYSGTSFPGFRLMQEYLDFPAKFMFADLIGLDALRDLGPVRSFELVLELSSLPHDMPPVSAADVKLNCVPAVNLFEHEADPIRVEQRLSEYRIRPSGADPKHYEVYAVNRVAGQLRGQPKAREYAPFFSFQAPSDGGPLRYMLRVAEALTMGGTDLHLTLVGAGNPDDVAAVETISLELECTNRDLARSLGIGDITERTPGSPSFASFTNLTAPTSSVPPPLAGDHLWALLSHMALNYMSILTPEALVDLVSLYSFRARVDRQANLILRRRLEGITSIERRPATRLYGGALVRGMEVELQLHEDKLGSEGEVYAFGAVLNEFLAHYVTLNAFSRLVVKGKKYGEVHTWPPRTGRRAIL